MKSFRSIGRTMAPFVLFALGVLAWLALAVTVGARPAPPVAAPAKPVSGGELGKPASPESSMVLETRAMAVSRSGHEDL